MNGLQPMSQKTAEELNRVEVKSQIVIGILADLEKPQRMIERRKDELKELAPEVYKQIYGK